jgi:hypothetical protein
MVVAFGRSNFQMEKDLVSISLEAAIGGSCGNLKVSLINDRVFSFCVANKNVCFHILKLRKISCQQFKCYFYLWGRGGPNWQWEFSNWKQQCDDDWILVSPSKRIVQKGLEALKKKAHHSSLSKEHNVKKKLHLADTIAYDACLGYKPPKAACTDSALLLLGKKNLVLLIFTCTYSIVTLRKKNLVLFTAL